MKKKIKLKKNWLDQLKKKQNKNWIYFQKHYNKYKSQKIYSKI